MARPLVALLLMWAALGLGAGPRSWTTDKWFDKPKSPRIANYRIEAVLDFEHRTLEGRETLSWRNTGSAPVRELPLHLYLNAFKGPQSLFMKESGGQSGPFATRVLPSPLPGAIAVSSAPGWKDGI